MANNKWGQGLSGVVGCYVVVAVATVVALVVMSVVAPRGATPEAWVHAVIVAVFAAVLPLRMRAVRAGKRSGLRAVGIISAVLFLVNVVEGLIPGFFPMWMRIEMIATAILMASAVLLVVRLALQGAPSAGLAGRGTDPR